MSEVFMVTPSDSYSILVVEDNPDIVIGLQDLLQHDGYQVTVAGLCAEALRLIRRQRFNAVLLDLGLPDGDGADVLKEMQRLDSTVPVIILTAHIAPERTVGSLIKGAFTYITKPYNRDELRQTLRRAIGVKELAVKAERAEHLLSESEDRFRSLVESATDAIILADGRGVIVSWNRAATRLFGYEPEEILGRSLTVLMPFRYRKAHEQGMARMEATGQSRVIGSVVELHGLRKDGAEFPIELSLATWKTTTGSYYSGFVRDTSSRKQTEQALEQLRHLHTLILTQAGEGIYGFDLSGRTTFVNDSAASMLGYKDKELLGRNMHDTFHHTRPDGSPYPLENCPIYAALKDGLVHRVEDDLFWKKDGTGLPVEYVSTPVKEGAEVIGAVVVFRDITDRIRSNQALRASEERLELVIRGSRDGFWDGRVLADEHWSSPRTPIWWSPRVREMLGYSETEFPDILESWSSRLHPDDRDRVFAALTAHIERRVPYDEEYRLLTKHGEYHWFRARGQAIWDADGRVIRMAGSLQSVMDRRQAEEAIRRSEQLLQSVADSTTAVIYVKDTAGRYLLINRRFEQIFGLSAEDIIGHTDHDLFPREIADGFRANDVEVLSRNATIEYEETAPHTDGLHTYISIKLPLHDQAGVPYAICGVSTDITERKRVEQVLRSHESQLGLALKAVDVGTWSWDIVTGRVFWSSRVGRIFGGAEEARALTVTDWLSQVHPDDRDGFADSLRRVKEQQGGNLLLEHRVLRQGGGVLRMVWTGQLIRDQTGRPEHALGTIGAIEEENNLVFDYFS